MPGTMTEIDEILFRSAENLRRASDELDAIMNSLWNMLETREVDLGEIRDSGDECGVMTDWVATAHAYNASVLEDAKSNGRRKRGRKKHLGTVTFVVRLCGLGEVGCDLPDWPWLTRACLIVGWHAGVNRNDWWVVENFEPAAGVDHIRNDGGRIWTWFEKDSAHASFFVAPLSALRNDGDLKRQILQPLKLLFEGGDQAKAFPDDSPVLTAMAA